MDKKKDIKVVMIGMTEPDSSVVRKRSVLKARNASEWGKVLTDEEIIQRYREAGLLPNGEMYSRQDMIDFANKAVSAYMDYGAVVTDHKGNMYPDWIKDNLPCY